jgi:glutathione S-transferase
MLTLFYKPGTCSLSPHIVLREAGLPFQLVKVDTRNDRMADGGSYKAVNPRGYVPAIKVDGEADVITEGPAIVQYIADQAPERKLAPPPGTIARTRLQEALNYVGTELHKGFSPLFNPKAPDEWKALVREQMGAKLALLDAQFAHRTYFVGDSFTVADAYLFVVLGWTKYVGLDLATWPHLAAFHARISQRPAVQEALKAEGLLK